MKWRPSWVNKGDSWGRRIARQNHYRASGAHRHNIGPVSNAGGVGVLNLKTGKEWHIEPPLIRPEAQFGSEVELDHSATFGTIVLSISALGIDTTYYYFLVDGEWVEDPPS